MTFALTFALTFENQYSHDVIQTSPFNAPSFFGLATVFFFFFSFLVVTNGRNSESERAELRF